MWDKVVKYRLDDIAQWLLSGWNSQRISKELNISPSQLKTYRDKYPELEQVYQKNMLTKYESNVEENLKLVEKWASEGQTQEFICMELGISDSMFTKYKASKADFEDAYNRGLANLHKQCFRALVKVAVGGYEVTEKTYKVVNDERILTKEVIKVMQPNDNAALSVLKLKFPDMYRDKSDVKVEAVHIVDDID